MRIRIGTLALLALFAASSALAQAPPAHPKPGPELQRLAYFEGKWVTEGTQKANPWGPAGKFSSNDVCKWVLDGFFLQCSGVGEDPSGAMKGIGLMGWSPENKVYTSYGGDNRGMSLFSEGTLAGKVWTFTSSAKMGGKTIKSRYVVTEGSPTEYTFTWEMADEKGSWVTLAEGKSTKAK